MPDASVHDVRECCSQPALEVDREAGLLRGVKVLGLQSRNGREYTADAARKAVPLYEGARVNLDHPEGGVSAAGKPRRVEERFGRLENVRLQEGGVYGDLRYNPHLPLAPAVAWWAEKMPDALGLSHNARARERAGGKPGGPVVYEEIVSVRSVDLVADPATTHSLFEGEMAPDMTPADDTLPDPGSEGYEQHVGHLIVAIINDASLDAAGKRKKVLKALKLLDDGDKGDDKPADEAPAEEHLTALRQSSDPHAKWLLEQYDRQSAAAKLAERRTALRQRCKESRLPDILVTEVFVDALAAAPDDDAVKALLEDRRKLAGGARPPVSAGAGAAKGGLSQEEFGKKLRAR